jgi:hypothetical protein
VIFYAIYKNQENTFTIGDILLQGGPRKENFLCNVAPGAAGRRGEGNFRRCAAGFRSGRARERSRGPKGTVCGSLGARGGRWEGARRRSVAPAAAAGNAGEGGGASGGG